VPPSRYTFLASCWVCRNRRAPAPLCFYPLSEEAANFLPSCLIRGILGLGVLLAPQGHPLREEVSIVRTDTGMTPARPRLPKTISPPRHRPAKTVGPNFCKTANRMGLRGLKKCTLLMGDTGTIFLALAMKTNRLSKDRENPVKDNKK